MNSEYLIYMLQEAYKSNTITFFLIPRVLVMFNWLTFEKRCVDKSVTSSLLVTNDQV